MSPSYEHDRGAPVGGSGKPSTSEGTSRRSQHRASALDRRLTTDMIIRDLHHNIAAELQGRMSHWDPPSPRKHEVFEVDREEDIVYGDDGHYKVERHIEVTTPYHLKRASSVLAPPDIIIQAPLHRALDHTFRPRSYTNPDHHTFTSYRSPALAGSLPRRDARDDVVYQFAPHKDPSESTLLYDSGRRRATQSLRPAFYSSRTANESGLSTTRYEHESSYYYDRW
ncbi:hypothetical protein FOL47_010981 [Perkinsus chesapeaki]|uniref:Uncharacterized protein n=1 Tax=Perkinsus chesapeaki TaxID=330153 RepID=A0A7J6MNK1_PERCH|nr:hypothetical protein FOL47_010981 [Perkinsus chesapeaki]